MPRRLLLIPVLALFLAVTAGANAGTKAAVLKGEVGPGFTIEVKTAAGKDVKSLKAGTYTIKVQDKASIHNFRLKGPGVNKATTVSFTGSQTWTVKLKAGKYTYQCDPHAASGMKGSFKVTG
jgi:plastocyanin